uniref:Uncharacterized protein n=1 Tax=Ciona savignyi TaxID=51511 RepID=H2Y8M3_CIOSA
MGEDQHHQKEPPMTAQQALSERKTTQCANAGNPLFSCMAKVEVVQDEMKRDKCYQPHHPLYQTSAGTYGELPATAQTAPSTF